jgi:hypothetical protein
VVRRASLATIVAISALAGCSNILGLRDLELDPLDGQDGATDDGGVGAEAGQEGGATDGPLVDGTSPDGPLVDGTTPDGPIADGASDTQAADTSTDTSPPACDAGMVVCGPTCVDLQTNASHCGACNHDCLGGLCTGGACHAVQVASGQGAPWDLVVDGAFLYFTNNGDGTVKRCATSGCGGAPTQLASGMNHPERLVVDSTYVYYTDYGTGTTDGVIMRVKKDASLGAQTLVSTEVFPEGIAVDATYVYWAARNAAGSIRIAIEGGGSASNVAASQPNATSVVLNGGSLFWATESGIVRRCTPSGTLCGTITTLHSTAAFILGLAVDANSVYFADLASSGTVYSAAKSDGSGIVQLAASQPYPLRLALDGTYVYWVNRGASLGASSDGSVMRCAVGGCGGNPTTIASAQFDPHGIAVDSVAIYWANAGDGSIWKLAK